MILVTGGTGFLGAHLLYHLSLQETEITAIYRNNSKLEDVKTEAGTGYYKTAWSASDIKPEMANVTLTKIGDGIAWGSLYWQYFEDLDKITSAETPLKLTKKLFLKNHFVF